MNSADPRFSLNHQNFRVAVYARAYEVLRMEDRDWLEATWKTITDGVKVDKVYLETHRDLRIAPGALLETLKAFYLERGVDTAGGITLTIDESNRFQTFCYVRQSDRDKVREVVEHTARHFDEIILDDFFFTNCKCEECIRAKGDRSWTEFRLELMRKAAQDLVIGPAKAVNPNVKVVVKYPNWYAHFQGLGFDLEEEPQMFDGVYTGTETRQAEYNHQHLQPYHGYSIVRYYENIAPGRNGGGWVDTGGMRTVDRYAEQLWQTLFAKAPEITLFDWRQLIVPVKPENRAGYAGGSFDFDAVARPYFQTDRSLSLEFTISKIAGAALTQIDPVLSALGKPVGVPSYRPPHSSGEDHLHSYIGMIGIPMDLRPEFPAGEPTIFLAEDAAGDSTIVESIEQAVRGGAWVTVTSGLFRALQDRGIRNIVEASIAPIKVLTDEFYFRGSVVKCEGGPVLLPQIDYFTNDAWELYGASPNGYPLLLQADYGMGKLNILAIPDNPMDLYRLPPSALVAIRNVLVRDLPFRADGPSKVAPMVYDNGAFVLESFRDEVVEVRVTTHFDAVCDVIAGEEISGEPGGEGKIVFTVHVGPHSYRAFRGTFA